MQREIPLESDIEMQNQSNVCLTFNTADKINLTDVVNIEKLSSLLKLKRIIAFMCRFMDNLKTKEIQYPKQNSSKPYFAAQRIKYCRRNIN